MITSPTTRLFLLRWLGAWQITKSERWSRCWYWLGNWRHERQGLRHRTWILVQAERCTFLLYLILCCCFLFYNFYLAGKQQREGVWYFTCLHSHCLHSHSPFLSFSFTVPIGMSSFKRLGIIMRNPGKSKHVEIAAVRVGSIAVDLVNLISPAGELYRIVPYCTVPYCAIPHRTVLYRTVPCYTVPCYTVCDTYDLAVYQNVW